MKNHRFRLFSALALVTALAMLFFTFFTLGWFSDVRGWEFGVELQINTAEGPLRAVTDILWTLAPFCLLISVFLRIFWKNGEKISAVLSASPLSLYALCQALLYFSGEEIRLPTWITVFFLLTVGIFTVSAAFIPEAQSYAVLFPVFHLAAEVLLFLLSLLLQEKLSAFYFSELLPMGHTSYFRYTFVLWSILFYYLCYEACLLFSALARKSRRTLPLPVKSPDPSPAETVTAPSPEKAEETEAEEDGEIPESISLEDLGIER